VSDGRAYAPAVRCSASFALIAALLVGIGPGCRQIAGIHERGAASDECTACVSGACAADRSACLAGSPCGDRLLCTEACDVGDAACRAGCERAHAGAGDAFASVETCRAGACTAACDLRCGGVAVSTSEASAAACDACMVSQCCAATSACAASADCARIVECLPRTAAGDAISGCVDFRYPAGKEAWSALATCRQSSCVDECDVGRSWSCVGHVPQRFPSADTVETDLFVVDAAQQSAPVSGLVVHACALTDVACGNPASPDVLTGADGKAAVVTPTTTQGGRPGFAGFLEVNDPQAKYLTVLGFSGSAITEPISSRRIIAATAATAQSFFGLVGLSFDVSRGYVISTVSDCLGDNGRGVTVSTDSSDPAVHVYYLRFGLPSASATETDAGGSLLIGPLPPGPVTLTGRNSATAQTIGSVRLFVRPGALSLAPLTPAPSGI
jgi:hypothetical protein